LKHQDTADERAQHSLGLAVVAEGVETKGAWSSPTRLGCDLVQGYYLSRPVPADALQLDWRGPARHIVGL
jgi:EAL domain-containing protein (putative c-di-GMP-specific phosphodiesterase class I)